MAISALVAVGTAVGASAGSAAVVGGLVVAGTGLAAADIGTSIYSADAQSTASKKAAGAAAADQNAANVALQTAQDTASTQAQNALTAKRQAAGASQDVFTSPLGLQTQAQTSRITLTGQ